MADVKIKTFRVDVTDWNGIRKTLTMTPQNWSVRKHGEQNDAGVRKFLEEQWKGNGAEIHSVKEVQAVVEESAFIGDRFSAAAKPRIVETPPA